MPLNPGDWRFTVAPMLDWTDRLFKGTFTGRRAQARLYTEMVTTGAIIHGDRDRLLGFSQPEHPVALQLGGSDPADLAESGSELHQLTVMTNTTSTADALPSVCRREASGVYRCSSSDQITFFLASGGIADAFG